jgi:hypothetical protein
LIFGEEGEIGFLGEEEKEDLMNKKSTWKYERFGRKNSSLFNTIFLAFLSIDALLLREKRKKRKGRREVVTRVMNVYTHTHTHQIFLFFIF